jgi:Protein of unknown function (DUF3795)
MPRKMLAVCGLDCTTCRSYIATKENDYSKLAETAKLWSRPEEEFIPEDIPCEGCHTERLHKFCRRCPVRLCAKPRSIINCGDCSEYTCGKLESLWKWLSPGQGIIAKANLEEYRKNKTI